MLTTTAARPDSTGTRHWPRAWPSPTAAPCLRCAPASSAPRRKRCAYFPNRPLHAHTQCAVADATCVNRAWHAMRGRGHGACHDVCAWVCTVQAQADEGVSLQGYEYAASTTTTNRLCTICSTCASGYATTPCTATTNTQVRVPIMGWMCWIRGVVSTVARIQCVTMQCVGCTGSA